MSYYDPKSMNAEHFINHEEILETIRYAEQNKHNIPLIDSSWRRRGPSGTVVVSTAPASATGKPRCCWLAMFRRRRMKYFAWPGRSSWLSMATAL